MGSWFRQDRCLFINSNLRHLEDNLSQFAQPEWSDDMGKLKVNKQPRGDGAGRNRRHRTPTMPVSWAFSSDGEIRVEEAVLGLGVSS